ncbi:MAG: exodeoxyribonuclease V subunit gamma [Rhabdochlamydiaceae bacterium]
MLNNVDAFVSNNLESLADKLYQNLYNKKSHFFEKRFIIVPNPFFKIFLTEYLGQKDILFGVNFLTLNQFLESKLIYNNSDQKKIPSQEELAILVQYYTNKLLQEGCINDLRLIDYLKQDEQRFISLCYEIASLFLKYGNLEKPIIEEWLSKGSWLSILWAKIYQDFTFPTEKLSNSELEKGQFHFFCFNDLNKNLFSLLKKQNLCLYHLSPCSSFWGDVLSQKQKQFFHKKYPHLKESDLQADPVANFLGDLGQTGKRFLNALEDSDLITDSLYEDYQGNTLLKQVQNHILNGFTDKEKAELEQNALSISLEIAPSKLREIEILLHNIINSSSAFKDMLVVAPDINDYAPFINFVFSDLNIPYVIYEQSITDISSFTFCLKKLLSLSASKYKVDDVFDLFSQKAFMNHFKWNQEQLVKFKKWAKEAMIDWGQDLEHQREILNQSDLFIGGSWKDGFKKLLHAAASYKEEIDISLTESEELEKFINVTRSLFESIKPLRKNESKKIKDWFTYFRQVTQSFFEIDESGEKLIQRLKGVLDIVPDSIEMEMSSNAIKQIVNNLIKKMEPYGEQNDLNALKFCSFHCSAPLHVKHLFLLDMKEGTFPYLEESSKLDEIKVSSSSVSESQKYTFLQMLMNVHENLTVSYSTTKHEEPSCVVRELFHFIDENYQFQEEAKASHRLITCHNNNPLDKSYFTKYKKELRQNYEHSLTYYKPKETHFYSLPSLETQNLNTPDKIDLRKMKLLARHPIQFYINETLGIFLKDTYLPHQNPLILPFLKKYKIKNKLLKTNADERWIHKEIKNDFHPDFMGEIQKNRLNEDANLILENLEKIGVLNSQLFKLELMNSMDYIDLENRDHWLVPSLKCSCLASRKYEIVGTLDWVSHKGLIIHSSHHKQDYIKHYPLFLIYLSLPLDELKLPRQVIFSKTGFIKDLSHIITSLELPKWLTYYQSAKTNLLPFMPEWWSALNKGAEDIKKKLLTIFDSYYGLDPYIEWLYQLNYHFDPINIHHLWSHYRYLFENLDHIEESDEKL